MPEWIYDALVSFQAFMEEVSFADMTLLLVVSAIGTFVLVAVHEAGHALAALAMGLRVDEVRVGVTDDLTLTAGSFRLTLGRLRADGDYAGYVVCHAHAATPLQVLGFTLAGPAANLLTAALAAALAVKTDGMQSVVLLIWVLASVATAITSLRATGDPDVPEQWSDGRWVRAAWAARGASLTGTPASDDPNAATSVPPPAG